MENIGLQDSLLSRFDLLFVMLDVVDNEKDQRIADFVVRMHRYRNPKEQDGEVLSMGGNYADLLTTFNLNTENDTKEMPIYEKYDALLQGESRSRHDQILSVQFMRKYIHLAKCLKPKLSEAASEVIASEYTRLRSQEKDGTDKNVARTQPITARTLETLIRLATAHAKARMGKQVTVVDANAAIELAQYAIFKKVLTKEKKKRPRNDDGYSSEEDEDMERPADSQASQRSPSQRRPKRTRIEDTTTYDLESAEDIQIIQPPDDGDLTRRPTRRSISVQQSEETPTTSSIPAHISEERFVVFKQKLNQAFKASREETLTVERLTTVINQTVTEPFEGSEIRAALDLMSEANQIMVADGIVFLI